MKCKHVKVRTAKSKRMATANVSWEEMPRTAKLSREEMPKTAKSKHVKGKKMNG